MFTGQAGANDSRRYASSHRRAASRASSAAAHSRGTTPAASQERSPSYPPEFSQDVSALSASSARYNRSSRTSRRVGSVAPSTSRKAPSVFSEAPSTARAGPSARALQESDERTLVKDEAYSAYLYSQFPREVQQVLAPADLQLEGFRGKVDDVTGYAYLLSRDYVFVWHYAQRDYNLLPTCYVFPQPQTESRDALKEMLVPLAQAELVPRGANPSEQEPGLLLVTSNGAVAFWTSVSMAMGNLDRSQSTQLSIRQSANEHVQVLRRIRPDLYVVATSQGRLFRLDLASRNGRATIEASEFASGRGLLARYWSRTPASQAGEGGITAVALDTSISSGQQDHRTLFALTERGLQIWQLGYNGNEQFVTEVDLCEHLEQQSVASDHSSLSTQLRLLDIAMTNQSSLAVLFSRQGNRTQNAAPIYSVGIFEYQPSTQTVSVTFVRTFDGLPSDVERPHTRPRLVTSSTADAACLVLPSSVSILSLAVGSDFVETLDLKDPVDNLFIAVDAHSSSQRKSGVAATAVMIARNGIVLIESTPAVMEGQALAVDVERESKATGYIVKRLRQAVFYGERESNPLAFGLPIDVPGDLSTAVSTISREIVDSSSPFLRPILDVRVQIGDRQAKHRALIEELLRNHLVTRLTLNDRVLLSNDAERLAAGAALWQHFNSGRTNSADVTMLTEAVLSFMHDARLGAGEDAIRLFFRTKIDGLGAVAEHVADMAARTETHSLTRQCQLQTDANAIFSAIYRTAAKHRKDTVKVFQLTPASSITIEPWLSSPALLASLVKLFELTEELLRLLDKELKQAGSNRTQYGMRGLDVSDAQDDLSTLQLGLCKALTDLGDYVLSVYEERLIWLKTDSRHSSELRATRERYLQLRQRVVHGLVLHDLIEPAYALAERSKDYRSLVELSTSAATGNQQRIKEYMSVYKDDFAFELYQYYIQQKLFRALLEQDASYSQSLSRFLSSTAHPKLAWLHHVSLGQYTQVSTTLYQESRRSSLLAEEKVMLSICKLAQVAQSSLAELSSDAGQRALEVVDDKLDIIEAQRRMQERYRELLSLQESQRPVDDRAAVIANKQTAAYRDLGALFELFRSHVTKLLQGHVLGTEALVDIMTLDASTDTGNFNSALGIIARDKDLPPQRRDSLVKTLWRRAYIKDDWEALQSTQDLSDDQISQILQGTAMFKSLLSAREQGLDDSFVASPSDAVSTIDRDQLAARFTELGEPQLERLAADLQAENDMLLSTMEDYRLDHYYSEALRLLSREEDTRIMEADTSLLSQDAS
ncbi:uncharacterized protein L969DRAFT_16305 [Mixia osmundae IAM 14324]|uniref:Nucleoporin Nup133/Nup155-like C-terminal domain-containing protein n=1 Tax=Mixia osmundae (strain CBS 9802 / IAM 14324 / JCM 22182 / KY 12970) TaxID=764103 RepID=G7DU27_MIXOS|nr:uncharacterized protein L969DRAFT_16305 [Mixia osmundae IAM 14324]KEI40954.1 hypothetical protein L969DRAFT_16305 [Mixia osmundae IAM 14324]GAA94087.1 hypothetical protein E5Q_00734 [Mixia osmundae IAM 14324]